MFDLMKEVMGHFQTAIEREERKFRKYDTEEIKEKAREVMEGSGYCMKCGASPEEVVGGECSVCGKEVV